MAAPQADADAKDFHPRSGMARIYVYRDTAFETGVLYDVVVDGEFIAATSPHTFVAKDVRPGEHTVTSEGVQSEGRAKIHADAGQCYFVRQQPNFANTEPEPGKKGVMECKLAADLPAGEIHIAPTAAATIGQGMARVARREFER